jgi:hypothetical protein
MEDSEAGREIKHDAFQHLIVSSSISHKKQNVAKTLNDHFLTMADTLTNTINMIIQMIMPSTLIMAILCLLSPRLILNIICLCRISTRNRKYNPLT